MSCQLDPCWLMCFFDVILDIYIYYLYIYYKYINRLGNIGDYHSSWLDILLAIFIWRNNIEAFTSNDFRTSWSSGMNEAHLPKNVWDDSPRISRWYTLNLRASGFLKSVWLVLPGAKIMWLHSRVFNCASCTPCLFGSKIKTLVLLSTEMLYIPKPFMFFLGGTLRQSNMVIEHPPFSSMIFPLKPSKTSINRVFFSHCHV